MKIKILKKHFDRAVKQPWNGLTCILAQVAREHKELDVFHIAGSGDAARMALVTFDRHFSTPGDEKKKALQKLRASLPIVIDLP